MNSVYEELCVKRCKVAVQIQQNIKSCESFILHQNLLCCVCWTDSKLNRENMSYVSSDPSKPERWYIVYPSYINSKKTIAEGRRIPKEKACENPTVNEIKDVCQSQNLNCSVENKQYPRDSAKDALCKGRVRVQLKNAEGNPINVLFKCKKDLFLYLGEMIPKLKSRQGKTQQGDLASSQTSVGNTNKKKKGKKGKGK
ncbi:signal recognition particle 19 kDa protein-like [Xenia sp. Carnegie-2017]|uniref:signal recognition particle 19 kDa protein-like n=1 Tax=Xenia sp. Carnegie-2017 TaxID=2897299 RepID=UPI001F03EA7F|nr:signal recognition particle 19 kDa protein-like [Xenia sp. Carnegie-2017]